MKIRDFIKNEVFLARLREHEVLVVYDPQKLFRDLCLELASDKRVVVDVSESSILSREAALKALQEVGDRSGAAEELIVYIPSKAPVTDEQKQIDPFAIYGACGSVFPEGDGDEFLNICLKAKADYASEIRRVFQDNPNPSFDVIDAVGGGSGWPNLQALLNVESARDLLFALLAPSDAQKESLKGQDSWTPEAKDLFDRCLGLKLKTRGKSWSAIGDELWRFILFSEFAFDLPVELPARLKDVPAAKLESRPLIEDLCDRLRSDSRAKDLYIERAEQIETELNLKLTCERINDLGVRDTFPFEERSYFVQAAEALRQGDIEAVNVILKRQSKSVWVGKGESQAQWTILQSAAKLTQQCDEIEPNLPTSSSSQSELIAFYINRAYEVDRYQREFEQSVNDYVSTGDETDSVTSRTRAVYRTFVGKLHAQFIRHLESSGWPPVGRLSNSDVFDKKVAALLEQRGHRVAYVLVDALRLELGVALAQQLEEDGQVSIEAAFASLPSITTVGMASLLPSAGMNLQLKRSGEEMTPHLGDTPLANVTQRMDILRKQYGQRFEERVLSDFIRGKAKLAQEVDLLVIRSNTIDSQFESAPEMALRMIYDSFKQIRVAVHKLRSMGFQEVIVAADHGFYLNAGAEAGDICQKPQGNWIGCHERLMLGDGTADNANFVVSADRLGVRGDFSQIAGPRALVAYKKGQLYFHGGASLQETVVPVLTVRLASDQAKEEKRLTVEIKYRRGAKDITTRLPVVELSVSGETLFDAASSIELLLEAQDKNGEVIGEAKPGGPVNVATHTVSVRPGVLTAVTLKMKEDFEGKFTVKALNPTTFEVLSSLELETNYMDAV